ncbi:MAG: flagellar biosynthesis protein FlhB [Anaerolineaceae bacterium]|nr:flagellar biosynthesis protein FlhB [Anaerolineaceae bacterium]
MADRTEAPTQRRLEDARSEGRVARSIELNSAAVLLASALLLRGPGSSLALAIKDLVVGMISQSPKTDITQAWLQQTFITFCLRILPSLGLFLVGLLLVGVSVTLAQTRMLWASKKVGFDFKRLDPIAGFKRIFSARGLIELGRALLKLGLIGWVAYNFLQANYPQIIMLSQYDLVSGISNFIELVLSLMIRVGSTYLVLAIADYVYQRWDLMRNLKMSKQEVKEDMKRSEGDPFLKSRIRAQQRRMARGRMMSNVPKATVVVTNPTHLAIAIEYHEGMSAPRVLAKGAMRVAQKIIEIAKENNIPIVQNIPLAHAIYNTIAIDQEITSDLYLAMAEVLAYVYRLRGKLPVTQTSLKPA